MPKILYFVLGVPTAKQQAEAQSMGAVIRNAKAWHPGDSLEECDAVYGEIPKGYQNFERWNNEAPGDQNQSATLEKMTVNQLKAYALENNIEIPADVKTKPEILAFIQAAKPLNNEQ